MVLAIADDAYHAEEGADMDVGLEVPAYTRCYMRYNNQDYYYHKELELMETKWIA
jgi:hypothetical protein